MRYPVVALPDYLEYPPEQMLERADQALYAEKRARAAASSHPGQVHARL